MDEFLKLYANLYVFACFSGESFWFSKRLRTQIKTRVFPPPEDCETRSLLLFLSATRWPLASVIDRSYAKVDHFPRPAGKGRDE